MDYKTFPAVYQQINQKIRAAIEEQNLPTGHVLPTLRELARDYEVSLRTAQLAVNELCDSKWAERVGKKLIVSRVPAGNNEKHTAYIVYYNADTSDLDVISAKILTGIQDEVTKNPGSLVILATRLEQSVEKCLSMANVNIGGIILLRNQSYADLAAIAGQFPALQIVQVNYFLDNLTALPGNVRGVFNDDFAGAFQGTEYLLSQGCRKPIFLELAIQDQVYRMRREGYLSAMFDHKLEGRVLVQQNIDDSKQLRQIYEEFVAQVYKQTDDYDGIFTCNDFLADIAKTYLKAHGRNIPILGYDDYAEFFVPHHSTIAVAFKEMGHYAIRQLQPESTLPQFYRILPRLKIRQSENATQEHTTICAPNIQILNTAAYSGNTGT